jgi:hypothetical protein
MPSDQEAQKNYLLIGRHHHTGTAGRRIKVFQDVGMNSFKHYALPSVGEWRFNTVGGIDVNPQNTGYKNIILRPHPVDGLTFACFLRFVAASSPIGNRKTASSTRISRFHPTAPRLLLCPPRSPQLCWKVAVLRPQLMASRFCAAKMARLFIKWNRVLIASPHANQSTLTPGYKRRTKASGSRRKFRISWTCSSSS